MRRDPLTPEISRDPVRDLTIIVCGKCCGGADTVSVHRNGKEADLRRPTQLFNVRVKRCAIIWIGRGEGGHVNGERVAHHLKDHLDISVLDRSKANDVHLADPTVIF